MDNLWPTAAPIYVNNGWFAITVIDVKLNRIDIKASGHGVNKSPSCCVCCVTDHRWPPPPWRPPPRPRETEAKKQATKQAKQTKQEPIEIGPFFPGPKPENCCLQAAATAPFLSFLADKGEVCYFCSHQKLDKKCLQFCDFISIGFLSSIEFTSNLQSLPSTRIIDWTYELY